MTCVLILKALEYLSVTVPEIKGEPKVFQLKSKSSLTKKNLFKCELCNQFYSDLASFSIHKNKCHTPDENGPNEIVTECPLNDDFESNSEDVDDPCEEKTEFERFLSSQRKRENETKKIECSFCFKSMKSEQAKKIHERTLHMDGSHTCRFCGKFFSIKVNGITHENRVHKDEVNKLKAFQCNVCGEGFNKEFYYDRHMKQHETGEIESKNSDQTCEVCRNTYNSKKHLDRHIKRMHSTNTPFTCQYCGKFFARTSDGMVHQRTVHRTEVEENKKFKCKYCIRGFDIEKSKNLHELHHETGELNCKVCQKVFLYRAKRREHEIICEGERLYICDYCSKSFTKKWSLQLHLPCHIDQYDYTCEFCSKSFKRKNTLKQHILAIHTESPAPDVQCEFCAKMLPNKYALKQHHRITHESEPKERKKVVRVKKVKNYTCTECGKTVANASNLRQHKKLHDSNKIYKCNLCEAEFSQIYGLYHHKLTHLDQKFQCTTCNASFKRKSEFNSHLKTHEDPLIAYCVLCNKSFLTKSRYETHYKKIHETSEFNLGEQLIFDQDIADTVEVYSLFFLPSQ